MRTKPGAGFSHQPKDTLAAPDTPSFPPSPPKEPTTRRSLSPATKQRLASSFSDLVRSTTAVPPSPPRHLSSSTATAPIPAPAMPRSRSASFSDDDLMLIGSSQALSSQGFGSQAQYENGGGSLMASPLRPMAPPNDVIDITDSPAASPPKGAARATPAGTAATAATAATVRPIFGQPTHMASPVAPRSRPPLPSSLSSAGAQERRRQDTLFNTNRNRAEHHRPQRLTGPLAPPKNKDRSVPPPRPVFSSLGSSQPGGGTVYPVSSYYRGKDINRVSTATPSGYADVDVYTDPDKATADLKALLEGGMEDDEDEEEEEEDKKDINAAAEKETKPKPAKKKAVQEYEGGVVPGINVKLLPHQVEGVKWMRGRELGPVKRGRVPKGGILADDMGLGKTLQSLSLIVTNRRPERDAPGWKKHYDAINGNTLVVAPLALIRQWEAEIKEKVCTDPPLRVCVHHGPQRTVRPQELARFDVVITTYQILVSEHGHSNDTLQSGCFGVRWWRVILDEAHSIKNRNAKMTKACCALTAEFRWCLSGTPMQNNLDELQSLVNFLRITPYDNLAEWRAHIDAPMKNGRGALAIRRLHSLLRCFMKRRTKDILKEDGALLPGGKKEFDEAAAKAAAAAAAAVASTNASGGSPRSAPAEPLRFRITERNVVSISAEFSPAERAFYDNLEERADKSLEKMMKGKAMSYANALVLLLRLRQACNHPDLLNLKLEKDKDALATDPVPAGARQPGRSSAADGGGGDIDALADALGGLGLTAKQCEVCMSDLTKEERAACEEANRDGSGGGFICAGCLQDREVLHSTSRKAKAKAQEERKVKRAAKLKKKEAMAKEAEADKAEEADEDEVLSAVRRSRQKTRNRRAVLDSDDDKEEEEAEGSWLVGKADRDSLRLGKAGGQEDEDAEGGGDWLNSSDDDSAQFSHDDDDDGSRLESFIVDDETASQKGRGRRRKKNRAVNADSDSATSDGSSNSDSDSDSDSDADSDSDSGLSASEVFSTADEDSFLSRGHGKRGSKTTESSTAVMVSAKIRKMLEILQAEADTHKFIVFSQFTSMLDLVAPFLGRAGLGYVRYDGGMRNDAREASLRSLRTDGRTRVLLCSLKCGALGLNLTAATRVVLLEPFWNPFVEEQAIDRVHRLTQTVDVTVYKLTVADTVEQRILALQDKKRLLAAQALEGGGGGGGGRAAKGKKNALKLGLQELMDLFKHTDRDGGAAGVAGVAGAGAVAAAPVRPGSAGGNSGLLQRRAGSGSGSGSGTGPQDLVYGRRW